MSLSVVSTPIGDYEDITLRAIRVLREAEVIIGEEFRETTTLLKKLDIAKPRLERLNEHSKIEDINELLELCRQKKVALISDCGTPGFCDPGAELVSLCRREKISVQPIPGSSSLMSLLAVSGVRLGEFIFRGFLPAKKDLRSQSIKDVARERRAQILMDTPYRLGKLLDELSTACGDRHAVIGLDMTLADESYIDGPISHIRDCLKGNKRNFVILLNSLK